MQVKNKIIKALNTRATGRFQPGRQIPAADKVQLDVLGSVTALALTHKVKPDNTCPRPPRSHELSFDAEKLLTDFHGAQVFVVLPSFYLAL